MNCYPPPFGIDSRLLCGDCIILFDEPRIYKGFPNKDMWLLLDPRRLGVYMLGEKCKGKSPGAGGSGLLVSLWNWMTVKVAVEKTR